MIEAAAVFLILGLIFNIIAVIGTLRFPDLYTRAQAIGIADTIGTLLMCVGLILLTGLKLMSLKIAFLLFLFFAINPTVVHAVLNAAVAANVKPWQSAKDNTNAKDEAAL